MARAARLAVEQNKDGISRAHYEHLMEQTGKSSEELGFEEAEPPCGGEHIWAWFWDLNSARAHNGFAPQPIGFLEIETFARLNGITLSPFEVDALRVMDRAFLGKR